MRISDRTIEAVRERAQIVDVFATADLKKAGREFLARCPWHDDRNPSLTVSPRTNRVWCFVCARGTDAIGWLQDSQGLSFTEAVLDLADRYNVPVETANAEDDERLMQEKAARRSLFANREQQQLRFQQALWLSPGLQYLYARGITNEAIETWGLGWNGRRVMFPLCDHRGRVVAFTGRVIDDSKPKYKNSQNDLIYTKSELVYGLHHALPEAHRSGHVVIVEGQMDVIACWQAGIRNVVAVSGSSLTAAMVERIVTMARARRITLLFDGDMAGRGAARRARGELQQLAVVGELDLRILSLPEGQDPADLALCCAQDLQHRIANADTWVAWWLDDAFADLDLNTPQGVSAGERVIREVLRLLPDGALREYVRSQCRQRLNSLPMIPAAKVRTTRQLDARRWAERRALRLYLMDTGSRPALADVIYQDETNASAMELIRLLEGMMPNKPESVAEAFACTLAVADIEVQARLQPLVHPIPEVRRVIEGNPVGELEGALRVLAGQTEDTPEDQCLPASEPSASSPG